MTEYLDWGHRLTWPEVLGRDRALVLSASAETLGAIARDLDLVGLGSLRAELRLRPWLDGVEARGRVTAVAQRLCGLTLDPFEEEIAEDLVWRIVPEGSVNAAAIVGGEIVIDLDADDPPEEAIGGEIDLTAMVIETFALALDPFPRKPGASFEAPPPSESLSPFSVLASMSQRVRKD